MLRSWWRHAFSLLIFLVVAACSGGGCSSGCAGCGMTPLPGGFPNRETVTNSGSARVTRTGLDFIAANAPALAQKLVGGMGGVYQYPIGTSNGSFSVIGININYTICPNGPDPKGMPLEQCTVDLQLGNAKFNVDAVYMDTNANGANALKIAGTIPVRLQELPVSGIPIFGTINVGLGQPSQSCDSNGHPSVDYIPIPVDVEIPLVKGTMDPRNGYTTVDAKHMVVTLGLQSSDLTVCDTCGGLSSICDAILGVLVPTLYNTLAGSLTSQVTNAVSKQLCTKPDPTQNPPCPTGSMPNGGDGGTATECVYTADPTQCVPIALGTNGHLDLSKFLAKISPGTTGGLDVLFAAGGDMDPAPDQGADNNPYMGHTPNGMTLGLLGGSLPSPQSSCVPQAMLTPPTGIPIPDEMKKDKQTPWPMGDHGPDVGIAIAGRFIDYALGGVYNSGTLCLGVTTDTFQQLNSGLLSVLIKSIKYLTLDQKPAAAAIATRPQAPPTAKIGGGTDIVKDPLLAITLNKFAIDFYIWSDDRFIRAFTYQADLTVPVNLETAKDPVKNPNGGLLPVVGNIIAMNGTVTNNDLLLEDPSSIANALSAILGGLTGQLTGSLKAFDISTALKSLGLGLTIPSGGIRKISKGTDDYLAIFADLKLAGAAMQQANAEVELVQKVVHPEAMSLSTFDREKLPELHLKLSSSLDNAASPVEYSFWIDDGTRSAWSTDRDVTVKTDYLFFQGKHTLYVSARVVGAPDTEDETPAELPYVIDVLAPEIQVSTLETGLKITAWDLVTDTANLVGRYQFIDPSGQAGAWSEWVPVSKLATLPIAPNAAAVAVEVRDEEGNSGSTRQALVRGRGDPSLAAGGSSCNCGTPGHQAGPSGLWALLLAAGLLVIALRRRTVLATGLATGLAPRAVRRAATVVGLSAVALGGALNQGCSCGSSDNNANNNEAGTSGCGSDCNQPCQPGLPPGIVGAYTSVAKAQDGTLWVAGYNDSAITSDFSGLYGDLVVGKYDSAKQQVQWLTVDGLPPVAQGACPDHDPNAWRKGWTDPGPDVGLWTSIQLDANNNPMVSYYDVTSKALKFASFDGSNWSSHTVLSNMGSDIGRYSKLLVINGTPVIGFLIMEKGNQGMIRSKVVVATATKANPASTSDWTTEDAAVDQNGPCRAAFCDAPAVCTKETQNCQPLVSGCTPADCGGNGAVCVTIAGKATCGTALADTYIDIYPNAFGDYVAMAPKPSGGVGMVIYDRLHGNLIGVEKGSSGWQSQILDGETGSRQPNSGPDGGISAVDTGDVGVGASLFITQSGDWHISYVNGWTEALQYMLLPGGVLPMKAGMPPSKPEIVDDGTKLNGMAFTDGLHLVGDDSFIQVDSNGGVSISYQDATAGTLRGATGAPMSGGVHQWSTHDVSQPMRFAGFFPHGALGDPQVANFWRATDHGTGNITGNVAFVNR